MVDDLHAERQVALPCHRLSDPTETDYAQNLAFGIVALEKPTRRLSENRPGCCQLRSWKEGGSARR